MIKVVAALIKKDNKYLIAKRSTGDINTLGKWEFPGGKVEQNENEMQAIEREILEEFELKVEAKEFITNNVCKYPNKTIDLKLYKCEYIEGNFKLHAHSEYMWAKIDEITNFELAPADIPLAQYLITHYSNKENKIENLIIGKTYTNKEIKDTFKCSNMSGMRRSKQTNSLVLIAKHDNPLYDDQWTEEGILNYTGMGTKGDQNINFAQNKTLANSNTNNVKIYLFESYTTNVYYYCGEVYLAKPVYETKELDEEGNIRKVIKFPLKRVDGEKNTLIDIKDIENSIIEKNKQIEKISILEIKKRAKNNEDKKYTKNVVVKHRDRNQFVSEYTKIRANGKCDLCQKEAPFKDSKGKPYLEEHHVITLANGGPDQIYNTVALCPNCHKKMHILKNKKDFEKLQKVILKYLEKDNDKSNIENFNKLFNI